MEAPGAPGQPPAIEASAAPVADAPRTERSGRRGARRDAGRSAPAAEGPRTVGRLIADALRSAGVRYAFTVPGESFLGLLDALGDAGIRVVATRHEGGAAFMAEAHGQLTGRPAVCLGTRGVGAANLAIGIHTARQDSTPMFAIIGQVENAHRGHEAFQEIEPVATIGGLAKWAAEPSEPADVAPAMSEAIRQALGGRPGPVLLSFAEDLLDQPAPDDARVDAGRPGPARPTDEDLRAVIELLASAERPVILGRRRHPARPHVDRAAASSRNCCRSRSSPPGAEPMSSRTSIRSISGWRVSVQPRRSASASPPPMRCSSSAAA